MAYGKAAPCSPGLRLRPASLATASPKPAENPVVIFSRENLVVIVSSSPEPLSFGFPGTISEALRLD